MKYIPFNFDWTFTEGSDRFFMFSGADAGRAVDLPHDYMIEKPRDPGAAGGAATGFFPGGDGSYTGTGFAQPNPTRISMIKPIGSMCAIGLSVMRPMLRAVGSPRR